MNEEKIEHEIQSKGLNAPRLNPDFIDDCIVKTDLHAFPESNLTVVCMTLKNGFVVTGESACASPENFDPVMGAKIAKENARSKIWQLEGYLLRQRLWEKSSKD